jgi:hypothetical protein
MRHAPLLSNLTWSDLDIELPIHPSRLVLRHNKNLQYGYTPARGETLGEALRRMEAYCKAHKQGNPKITGAIKVVEHTRLNGAPLWVKLTQWLRNNSE